jgi:hypothetical protein
MINIWFSEHLPGFFPVVYRHRSSPLLCRRVPSLRVPCGVTVGVALLDLKPRRKPAEASLVSFEVGKAL